MRRGLWIIAPIVVVSGFSTGWAGASLVRQPSSATGSVHAAAAAPSPSGGNPGSPLLARTRGAPASSGSLTTASASLTTASGGSPLAASGSSLPAASGSALLAASGSASPSALAAAVPAVAAAEASVGTRKGESRRKRRRQRRLAAPAAEFYAPDTPPPAPGDTQIVVSRASHRLYLYRDGQVVKTFKVGVGKHRGSTPSGRFHIIGKAHKPAWNYKGRVVPGGVRSNPLGNWWLGLSVTHRSGTRFGIHGTNAPWSIGGNVSRGCIRMHNRDAARLFREVGAGTPVTIY